MIGRVLMAMLLCAPAYAGYVHVSSTPTEAEVWRNEVRVGMTPYTVRAEAGKLKLELRKAGYETKTVEVEVGEGVSKSAVTLQPKTARLDILADHLIGWSVVLDGKPTWKTVPCSLDAAPGKRVLSFVKEGYQDLTVRVSVSLESEAKRVTVERKPYRGRSRLLPLLRRNRILGKWTKADSGTTFDFQRAGKLTKTTLDGKGLKHGTWRLEKDGRVSIAIRGLCSATLEFRPDGSVGNDSGWDLQRKTE